jgi:hypothetical protein
MHTSRLSNATSVVLLATLAAVLLAACGASPKPTPAASSGGARGAGSFKSVAADAYKQSACMRRHGVPNFPDPKVVSNAHQQMIGIHVTPAMTSSPSFKSAQKACAYLMPQSGGNNTVGPSAAQQRAHTEGILAFAACMRTHGFKSFPDPDNQGNLTPAMLQRANIDLQQPAVKPAADACAGASHGQITKADINQAIANPGGNGG